MAQSPPLPSPERKGSLVSEEKPTEYGLLIEFYSKLTTVFRDKDYLPHLVSAKIISLDNNHHLSGLSSRDRAMRILECVSDSLDGGNKQCFYNMLEIMKDHGNSHAQSVAEDINKAIVSGTDYSYSKSISLGSVGSTRSNSIGSAIRSDSLRSDSDSLRSGSVRSDSLVSTATSTGEVSLVDTCSTVNSINFAEYPNISEAFLLLTTEISNLLQKANFSVMRRALLQQRRTPRGVQFPDDLHQSIKAAKELDTLLDVLAESDYWNWVDLRLLDALIISSGIQEAKLLIKKYKDVIFPKKLSEVLDNLPLLQQKEDKEAYTTKVGTKIQKEPDDITVGDLSLYCNRLESVIMDINNGSCVLEHIDTGCLEILWLIPTHCRFHAYKSALNNRHKFCDMHLQYLHIEPYPPIYDPFTIQPAMLSKLLTLSKPIAATPEEVISHYYCFLLEQLDNNTICQIMLEMKLLSEKDLVHSAKMYSDYQKNAFLVNRLLVTETTSIVEFCHLLKGKENQPELGEMLINDIDSIPTDRRDIAREHAFSQSFSIEESDEDEASYQPEVFLATKTVHIRFLNLVCQLKQKLKDHDPQQFLEICDELTASASPEPISVIPSEYLMDLNDADTEDIFDRLSFLWAWNHHSVLKALLEACNCQDGVKMLDTFTSEIDANLSMELFPIPPPSMKMVPSLSSAYTILFIRMSYDLDEPVSLQYINDVAAIMLERFGVSSHALQLLAGCVNPLTLYWVILKSIMPLIRIGINKHINFFQENQFTEIIIYPSTVLFSVDNLNLGLYSVLDTQEIYKQDADLQAEVSQLKSSKKYLSNELRKLKDKYHSLSQDFGKAVFLNEAEGVMDQLEEMLTEIRSQFEALPHFEKFKDNESNKTVIFPSLDYSEMVIDVSQRSPVFLSRMQDFRHKLEEMKEWYKHVENLERDLSAKDQEVNHLKSNVDGLTSDLIARDQRNEQLHNDLNTLQSEYDKKLKEIDGIRNKYQIAIEENRKLMEKESVDSDIFSEYSIPDSLEYDPKEKKTVLHYGAIMGHVPLVQMLTKFGADVNAVDKEKKTALHYGAFNGHVTIVEILVNAGADINAGDEDNGTALLFSAANGYDAVVDLLIRLGANVNVEDEWTPLHAAARSGHVTIVETLIKSGADVGTDINKWTPLHVAAKNGHLAVVEVLIKYGANLYTDMVGRWTPVHAAARHGHAAVVEALITSGANADAAVINKWAPLHVAANHGHVSVIESLVGLGANVNARSTDNKTPLLSAAKTGRHEVAETLIKLGADVQRGDMDKWTPLHAAARQGHITVVEVLINSGADVCAPDIDKYTPMHGAAEKGHDAVVKTLINHNADVNAVTVKEQSPLHLAAEHGHAVVVEALTKSGANIDCATREKHTPLHLAALNGHVQVVDTLIKLGANINASTIEKQSPLHIAAEKGQVSVVETLIESHANLDAVENHNWTPLHLAIKKHHVLAAETLIRSGANVNAVDKNESSALHFAIENNYIDVVDLLVKSKADVNANNKAGLTPLHIAAQSGYIQAVKTLLEFGASVNVFNKNLYCPLHLAAKSGHIEMIETLVKAGADINAVNDKNKWTPLHVAVREDNALVVEKLITLGANMNAVNILQFMVLSVDNSYERGPRNEMHRQLQPKKTKGSRTPLQEAVQFEKQSVIYYFVMELKVDTKQLDEYSQKWIEGWQRGLFNRPIKDYDYDSDYSAASSGHESDASREE